MPRYFRLPATGIKRENKDYCVGWVIDFDCQEYTDFLLTQFGFKI